MYMNAENNKVFVIGLDSASPELFFGRFLEDLPNIRRLLEKSIYGSMESTIPAITIPAWMTMVTGKDPGELGLYGFRHRKSGTYNETWIANSLMVKEKAIWHYIAEKGKKSVLIGIPPSYPPMESKRMACFLLHNA